jgi:hypothetical protein
MSQLRSNHRSGLAIVDSLALHQDIARILDGSLVAATGFETEHRRRAIAAVRTALSGWRCSRFLKLRFLKAGI